MSRRDEIRIPSGSRVLAAMSGGVDSSVAAHRLVAAGMDVTGITMHLVPLSDRLESGAEASDERACCSIEAAEDARRVASRLGIPHYMLNLADEFRKKVMNPAREEYSRGRTPNPCILCNRFMKFDILREKANQLGCEYIATGHYCRIIENNSGYHLFRGIDAEKDQSYFLAYLTEKELAKIVFPLGGSTKESVRKEARKAGLKVADRPESQDLCFFASHDPGSATLDVQSNTPGEIITTDGTVVGTHEGISGYTIGQRKGVPGGMAERMFVVSIDAGANRVVIGTDSDLFSSRFHIEELSLVSWDRDIRRLISPVQVQVRYRSNTVDGLVRVLEDRAAEIELEQEVRAVTPGQAAVLYDGDEVIGAGTITNVEKGE